MVKEHHQKRKLAVKRGEEHRQEEVLLSEGSSYGLYKGSTKPSGAYQQTKERKNLTISVTTHLIVWQA